MKTLPLWIRLVVPLACFGATCLRAADEPEKSKNGYTVTIDMKMNEEGEVEGVKMVSTEDTSAGQVLDKMALAMASKTKVPPRLKDGKPVKFTVRAPFFFPIDDDEGAAANKAPMPHPKKESAVMPVYPPALREAGVVGGAVLELHVDADGKLTDVKTMRASHPEFQASAVEAVKKWVFAPAQKEGAPVASRTRLAIVYETGEKMADLKWRVAPRPALGTFVVIRPDEPIQDGPAPAAPGSEPAATAPGAAVPTEPGK
ncbi:MAG: energy transducer TonB [Opitutus sp.]